jgi:hypothetical protein
MALLHIPLNQITEDHLNRLIENRAIETRDIEYKSETYDGSDDAIAEWLADISSFANTTGGDLVIGMESDAGVAKNIRPLTINTDKEKQRLESLAQDCIQPRLANLQIHVVPIKTSGHVLVVRIPRSYNPPHRLVRARKGNNRFYARNSAGKYEPSVDQLRLLFNLAPQLADRIRDFRSDRVAKITVDDTPSELLTRDRLALHIVPFSSFDPASLIDLTSVYNQMNLFPPMGTQFGNTCIVNFDGVLFQSLNGPAENPQRAYTLVYRSGKIEGVTSSMLNAEKADGPRTRLAAVKLEELFVPSVAKYLRALNGLNIGPPYAVMVSLLGAKGNRIHVGAKANWFEDDYISTLKSDQYHFGEAILETIPSNIQECAKMLRPIIEQIANVAGRAASTSFDQNGDYVHHFAWITGAKMQTRSLTQDEMRMARLMLDLFQRRNLTPSDRSRSTNLRCR